MRAGPSRFSADVDDVGALGRHDGRPIKGCVGTGIAPAVGERIGGHVQDAHDGGPCQIDDSVQAAPLHGVLPRRID